MLASSSVQKRKGLCLYWQYIKALNQIPQALSALFSKTGSSREFQNPIQRGSDNALEIQALPIDVKAVHKYILMAILLLDSGDYSRQGYCLKPPNNSKDVVEEQKTGEKLSRTALNCKDISAIKTLTVQGLRGMKQYSKRQ